MSIINKQFWCEFIDIYQDCEELWNAKCEKYKNKTQRCKAWVKLADKLKEIDPSANVETAKKRINNMRTCFRREFLRRRKSIESGATGEDLYVPALWYFEHFHFITDAEDPTDGGAPIKRAFVEEPTETPTTPAPPPAKPKRIKVEQDTVEVVMPKPMTPVANNTKQPASSKDERDEADVFAEGWAICYRKLSPEQQIYAKKAIDEILVQGRLERLTLNSFQPYDPMYRIEYASSGPT